MNFPRCTGAFPHDKGLFAQPEHTFSLQILCSLQHALRGPFSSFYNMPHKAGQSFIWRPHATLLKVGSDRAGREMVREILDGVGGFAGVASGNGRCEILLLLMHLHVFSGYDFGTLVCDAVELSARWKGDAGYFECVEKVPFDADME